MTTILNSVNKTIEEKWAPTLKVNPKKKLKSIKLIILKLAVVSLLKFGSSRSKL